MGGGEADGAERAGFVAEAAGGKLGLEEVGEQGAGLRAALAPA